MHQRLNKKRLESLEILEATNVTDSHFLNVENCKKGTKDKGASGNRVNSSVLTMKVACWHVHFSKQMCRGIGNFPVFVTVCEFIMCFL